MKKVFKFIMVLSIVLTLSVMAYAEEDRTLENNQWYLNGYFYEVNYNGQVQSGPSISALSDEIKYVGSSDDVTTSIAVTKDNIFLGFYNAEYGYFPYNNGWAVYHKDTKEWTGKPAGIPETYAGSPTRFFMKDDVLHTVLSELEYELYPKVYKTLDGITWQETTLIPSNASISSWAEKEVSEAIALKLVPESLQSKFTQDINRLEFCQLIVNYLDVKGWDGIDTLMASKKMTLKTNPFSDTNDKNVNYAYSMGIINGKTLTTFDPKGKITREEAAVMLHRTLKIFEDESKVTPASFKDKGTFASWSDSAIATIGALEIMNGKSGNIFAPKDSYTREQAYMTIDRLFKYLIYKN